MKMKNAAERICSFIPKGIVIKPNATPSLPTLTTPYIKYYSFIT
jgi:hypothetical protein